MLQTLYPMTEILLLLHLPIHHTLYSHTYILSINVEDTYYDSLKVILNVL